MKTMAQVLDSFPDRATKNALINLLLGDPAVRRSVMSALRNTIEFRKGRGALLASLRGGKQ